MYKAHKQIKVMYAQQYEGQNSWLIFNKPIIVMIKVKEK
jgi:hypothetical protein